MATTDSLMIKLQHRYPTATRGPKAASDARRVVALVGCPLAAGGLMWASFFPLNQGWCAWFALVPLLYLVRAEARPRTINLLALLAGLAFYFPALKWMRVAHPMMMYLAWPALSLYLAIYFPLAIWLLRKIDRLRLPFALTLPVVWVSLEFMRAHFLTGFAWYFLGHTQHDYLAVIQIADLGGVYAVSFLVAAVNGLLFDLVTAARFSGWPGLSLRSPGEGADHRGFEDSTPATRKSKYTLFISTCCVALLFAGCLGYGVWRLSQVDFAAGPRVAMLQTNIPQYVRNDRDDENQHVDSAARVMISETEVLTTRIKRENQNPDLIVWPETTFVEDWLAVADGTRAADLPPWLDEGISNRRKLIGEVATFSRAGVLLGLNTVRFGPGLRQSRFNSALLVDQSGKEVERYDKIHRVMFGEYLPARETLPFMQIFSPYPHDYSLTKGEHLTRLPLATKNEEYRFGVLICFEDSDAMLSRGYARETEDGPPVDFLVNISNDGWFNGTEEHELHLAISRFRAVEARRALVRSVNMGISALVDGNGRVRALPGPSWRESKKIAAAFTAEVPIDSRVSVYARVGDWLATCCAAACVGLIGRSWRSRKFDPTNGTSVAEIGPRP